MPDTVDRYNVDPLDGPANQRDYIRDLERRIAALEGQPFVGSNLTFTDADGVVHGQLGLLTGAGGSGSEWGVEVVKQPGDVNWPNGYPLFRATDHGAQFPYIQSGFILATSTPINVTSGTFVDTWIAGINLIDHEYVGAALPVSVDVGTTGEMRIANATAGVQSPAFALSSGASGYQFIPAWAHTTPIWTGPILFSVQARRVSGSGNVGIYNSAFGLSFQPR